MIPNINSRLARTFVNTHMFTRRYHTSRSSRPSHLPSRSLLSTSLKGEQLLNSRFVQMPTWHNDNLKNHHPFPRTYDEHRHRAFLSTLGKDNSDGLGHRFTMINFELNVAYALNVGYIHRRSRYGSLTPWYDRNAVERTFGWLSYPHLRHQFLRRHCHISYIRGHCHRKSFQFAPLCQSLLPNSTFRSLVKIPSHLTDCMFQYITNRSKCISQLQQFALLHSDNHTLFQMVPTKCTTAYRDPLFNFTGHWLRHQYWNFHYRNTSIQWLSDVDDTTVTRILPFDSNRIQIAVHIRRGDFSYFKHRHQVSDTAYAALIAQVKLISDFIFQHRVAIDVLLFSEGVSEHETSLMIAHHNVSQMKPVYLTELGQRIKFPRLHFQMLISKYFDNSSSLIDDIRIRPFIATETVGAIHAMVCADVFIGSLSALSVHLVTHLARGVVLLPRRKFTRDNPESLVLRFDDMKSSQLVNKTLLKRHLRTLFSKQLDHPFQAFPIS